MILSKREKMILYGAIAMLVLFIGNQFVINPVLGHINKTHDERLALQSEVEDMENLLDRKKDIQAEWKGRLENGLSDQPAATESALYKLMTDEWPAASGFSLPSINRQRNTSNDTPCQEIIFSVSGSGTLEAAARLLYEIEQSRMPVRISNLQMSSPEDNGWVINLSMRLSVLYLDPTKKSKAS